MPHYWIIAPVEAGPLFDNVWQFDLSNDIISIGWGQLGDTLEMSQQQLEQAVEVAYPARTPASKRYIRKTIWTFVHDINLGDFVIARRGLKVLEAVGRVSRPAFYEREKNPFLPHPRFLGVSWEKPPHRKEFLTSVFIQNTIQTVTEEHFQKLLKPIIEPEPVNPVIGPAVEEDRIEIILEKYLQELVVSNFDTIFKGELTIFKDDDGKGGQQYPTDVGLIDILAFEPKSKSFVIIELKRGTRPIG